ncbi:hypothetical protein FNV62_40450 [Streptomyces sp. RLB3-17]|uniref:DUF5994 family protein n=1 Tax=Streptomyces sp. RLB3-17 TaxID=2594455 RepID=UPI001163CFA0|nr:DUF5994 family protein [Streptomyces sp. RLB3-17]QDO43558.1 hypothetical protein FNV62_40450 [Streptomyces sp. RLB3-17]
MSATISLLPPPPTDPAVPAARLSLKAPGTPRGLLDGAWWPRSRDLLRELPDLTDVLDPHWGRITRIAVNPAHWPVIPRKVPVHGHVVKVGWFTPELDPHKVLLLSYSVGRWDLLVIPPETRPAVAARLMAAASDPTGAPLTASALMAVEEARHGDSSAGRVQNPEEAWEYEGGASSTHAAAVALAGRPKAGV